MAEVTRKDTPAKHPNHPARTEQTAAEKAEAASWARATARGETKPGTNSRTK